MSKYVMHGQQTGTRNGVDWPKIGEPAPDDLTDDEVKQYLAFGLIVEAKGAEPDVEKAIEPTKVETATVPARGRAAAAAKKAAAETAQGAQQPAQGTSKEPVGQEPASPGSAPQNGEHGAEGEKPAEG